MLTEYTTTAGESIAGIALRRLANETRWCEIRDLNANEYPDMTATDYYPVGISIKMPAIDVNNFSEEGKKILKSLEVPQSEQDARKQLQAEMLANRQREIAENIAWWKQQEKWRIDGFDIVQTDPMYVKMTKRYQDAKLEECYKEFISVPLYDYETAKKVLRKH